MVELRELGKTEIRITPIGLGCWQFSGGKGLAGRFWPNLDNGVEDEIVRISLEHGVNWFDTAEMYGGGASERSLNRALKAAGAIQDDIVLATKWNPILRPAGSIRRTISNRQEALGDYRIDLHQVHNPASLSTIRAQMNVMADLVEAGNIRSVGVSNFRARAMRKAHVILQNRGISLASNQVHYHLLNRRIEKNGVLDTAKELGITIIAYSPMGQGLLSGKFHDDPDLISRIDGFRPKLRQFRRKAIEKTRPLIDLLKYVAGTHDATPAQVALNWLVHFHGDLVVAIPGATKPYQAKDNARSMNFRLSDSELAHIDEIARSVSS
ncbi:MAG: aldo/keto reductase [Bacteroidetes bacterium]|nr:aldo/keto reductase [Bacteroidota bacterium]